MGVGVRRGRRRGRSPEARLFELLTSQPRWVHRRVDRVVIEADGETTRHVSFDLTIPAHLALPGPGGVLVPLMLLQKRPLRRLDTEGADGRPMAVLGRADNGPLAADMILSALESIHGQLGPAVSAVVEAAVHEQDQDAMDGRVDAMRTAVPGAPLGAEEAQQVVLALAEDLARQFLLVVVLPHEAIDRRVIIKLGFGEDLPARSATWPFDAGDRALGVVLHTADAAASAHFEFRAPAGLRVRDVRLLDADDEELEHPGPSVRQGYTVHLTGLEAYALSGPVVASLELEPVPEGLVRQTAVSTLLIAVLLLVAACSDDRLRELVSSNRIGAVAGAALTAPTLFLSLQARRPEHAAVARALWTPRLLNIATALLLYTAALLVVTASEGSPTFGPILWWIFAVQTAITLWAAMFYSRVSMPMSGA